MTFGQLFALFVVALLPSMLGAFFAVKHMLEMEARWEAERGRWEAERQSLLNRIQAGSLSEFQHLTYGNKPRIHNPLKKAFMHPEDIPDEPKGVTADGS